MTHGAALARGWWDDVVAPSLAKRWPRLRHAAGRLGGGSDVLGLDDEISRDHDWGLRLTLVVDADVVGEVTSHLEATLPASWAGLPARFALTRDPVVRHRVEVTALDTFLTSRLGLDATGELTSLDWLCLTGQSLLEVTGGPVFVDTAGELTAVRRRLAWYPEPVWRHVVAADWISLGEDLPLLGRTGQRGDDLGSRVLAGRIVRTSMHLAFMLARRWPPYPKWIGTMLTRLPVADELVPALTAVVSAGHWLSRQEATGDALAVLCRAQAEAGLPVPAAGATRPFFDRPFLGVRDELSAVLDAGITDPLIRRLRPGIGAVEQWADSVQVLTDAAVRVQVARRLLDAAGPGVPG